eukprot:5845883-Pleurochrysis_carterae.AAC.1
MIEAGLIRMDNCHVLGLPCSCEACTTPIHHLVPSQPAPAPAPHGTAALELDPPSTVVYASQPPQSHVLNLAASPPTSPSSAWEEYRPGPGSDYSYTTQACSRPIRTT